MADSSSPSPPVGRGKKPVVAIAGAVATVALLGIVLVFMFGFTSSPSETVEEFFERQNSGEYTEALELMTEEYAADYREREWDGDNEPPQDWIDATENRVYSVDIKDEQEAGGRATVVCDLTIDGRAPKEGTLLLKWEDGRWLIHDDAKGSKDLSLSLNSDLTSSLSS